MLIDHCSMMAASIYATPPPDLNGEDTSVLSDTSNSSHTNSSHNSQHKAPKRSILVSSPSTTTSLSTSSINAGGLNLFDSTPDMSKKRRKQTTPIRISATNSANELQQELNNTTATPNNESPSNNNNNSPNSNNNNVTLSGTDNQNSTKINGDEEKSLQKIFLKNLSQLQSHAHLPTDDSELDPTISAYSVLSSSKHNKSHSVSPMSLSSPTNEKNNSSSTNVSNHVHMNHNDQHLKQLKIINENKKDRGSNNVTDIENDIEVEYHNKFSANNLHDTKSNVDGSQKEENPWNENDESKKSMISHDKQDKISKPDEWLSLAGLPFPFPPEAAAALSAYGSLPQLPLLSSVGPFGGADGVLSRGNAPPLRIFNPEAYCDLCNKEFCNKYFLKTHKANKHGIYEPPMSGNDINPLSQLSQMQQMSQVLQMQQQSMQQQFNQQQLQQQHSPNQNQSNATSQNNNSSNNNANNNSSSQPDILPSGSQSSSQGSPQENIFCDVCLKRFSNLSSLRKHRMKFHEVGNKNGDSGKSIEESNNAGNGDDNERSTPFRMPEGFREDYQIEQEDINFTPQPRKLSPSSMQQAKDANFSFDKLKRLGVINPEAFCELCCKEYCNKYFLRTHKLKRHGIFLPPDDMMKDDPARTPWNYQTSPLNLIIGSGEFNALHLQKRMEAAAAEAMKHSPELEFGEIKKETSRDIHKENDNDKNDDDDDEKHRKSPPIGLSQQESEAISVDLQKLQSMILQLNELNHHRNIPCAICGKEMENQYMLHAHMLSEHANLANNNNNAVKLSPRPSPVSSPNEFEICKHCDKEFSNIFMLKQHLIEMHGMAPISPLREGFVTPERPPTTGLSHPSTPTQMDRKPMFQMTPTSSYCEICNKELCNKYFMKTHMQRMHGIEIENGAQIGGVVCNVCNKELCSKYFLRVHKHNTHGIVEDGSPLPQQTRQGGDSVDSDSAFPMDLKPGEVSDLSNRYYSHFTEVCPLCSRRFRSAKWLKAHLMSDHGKAGTDKLKEIESKVGPIKAPSPTLKIPNGSYGMNSPEGINSNMLIKNSLSGLFSGENPATSPATSSGGLKGYQCSFCSFSTPILAILFIHERSHSGNSGINLSQNQIKSESAVSIAKEQLHISQPPSGVSSSDTPTSTPASTPVPSTPQETVIGKPEYNNILNSMANLTQRPAIYALPQESGPLVMQSFLLEESSLAKNLSNGKSGNIENKFIPSVVVLPVKERISSPITISFTLTPA